MVYRGKVCGDVIVLANGIRLPDGSEVLVELVNQKSPSDLPKFPTRNGVEVFPRSEIDFRPDMELVHALRDDEP
jgi:hypothetical protein